MTQDKYIGALIGLTVAFPLLGRFGHLPASIIGVTIPLSACVMVWRNFRVSPLIYVSLGVLLILILQAAQRSQFQFPAHPALWLDHGSRYFQSKLMMFLIAFLPVGLAAVVASSFSGEPRDRLTGILWSFILVAIAGFPPVVTLPVPRILYAAVALLRVTLPE